MLTQLLFAGLVAVVAAQRLWEMSLSRRHERQLLARGATEHAPGQMRWMVLVHGGWLVAMLVEVFVARRPFVPPLAAVALVTFGLGQALRIAAMRTLGPRWTVKVITPARGEPPVTDGIYRHLRHPNYVGVAFEIAALPLVHSAYLSAIVFSLANAGLLYARIRAEEAALCQTSDYAQRFGDRPRLLPALPRGSRSRSGANMK